jgi:catechol 2,3-dioxygenase-like lactoylglutathione lyase family enzyme
MIHHVSLGTNDVERSKRFYDAVLPIVGIHLMAADEGGLGYGSGTFHFSVQVPIDGKPATVGNGTHIAFAAENREMVERFYAAALITAAATTANRDCAPTTMQTTMARSSVIRTGTKSRL